MTEFEDAIYNDFGDGTIYVLSDGQFSKMKEILAKHQECRKDLRAEIGEIKFYAFERASIDT